MQRPHDTRCHSRWPGCGARQVETLAMLQVLLVASSHWCHRWQPAWCHSGTVTAIPGSASHVWKDGWEAKGQGRGCPMCHSQGLEWGTRSPAVQMWAMGARGCAVCISMCWSICPCCVSCSPIVGARTTQTPTLGSSLTGSPGTPRASDLVGASTSATPVPDPKVTSPPPCPGPRPPLPPIPAVLVSVPFARARPWGSPSSLRCHLPAPRCRDHPFSSPPSLCGDPLRCSPAAGASMPVPLSGATSAHLPLRYRFFPAGPSRRGLCG